MANNQPNQNKNKSNQRSGNASKGFASMPREKVREIASKGGQAPHSSRPGRAGRSSEGSSNES